MKKTYEKLREARMELGLSQSYAANSLGISRTAVTQIELGNRNISAEELTQFCRLYHLSADYLLDTKQNSNQTMFARSFEELTENDQQEVLNLIAFKKAMTSKSGNSDAE